MNVHANEFEPSAFSSEPTLSPCPEARVSENVQMSVSDFDTAKKSTEDFLETCFSPALEEENKEASFLDVADDREHVNLVFIGHVDAGKSTISGQILIQTGQIEPRLMQKYEREAKEKNRDSWLYAFIMDTNEEERLKGKTIEVGRAQFSTALKRYTILDAPGHKNYVPNMIGGAAQADIGVLVISARKNEFETGFERGGQTREHTLLANTFGVRQLIVVINKMDDQTVQWSEERYNECKEKLSPFLKRGGYNVKRNVEFLPISGYLGYNITHSAPEGVMPWYTGRTLLAALDSIPPIKRNDNATLRIPVIGRYKDMGTMFVLGKIESGILTIGTKMLLVPPKLQTECLGIIMECREIPRATPGENILLKVKNLEEEDVQSGFVLCSLDRPCCNTVEFDAQIVVLDLLEHKPIITAGYFCVLHIHSLIIECEIVDLLSAINKKTWKPMKKKPTFCKSDSIVTVRLRVEQSIAVEPYSVLPQMGRFTLRDEGRTIAIGKVTELYQVSQSNEAVNNT
jgi:peptide chain release factor subunit 3